MKRNEIKTTVTHGEILCYALENLMEKQRNWEARAEKIKNDAHDTITAKEFLSHSPYKDKITVLQAMYKFEFGEDYVND